MRTGYIVATVITGLLACEALGQGVNPPVECPRNRPSTQWSACIGTLVAEPGRTVYSGGFLNGSFHGYGVLRDGDSTYSGGFRDGRLDGQGVLAFDDGTRYVGDFRQGVINGIGRLLGPDGREIYAGPFVDGKPAQAAAPAPRPAPPVATPPQPPAPAPVRPAVAAAPAAPASSSVLPDGVYLRTQMFGTQLYMSTFQVLGNRIAEAPRRLLGPSDFNLQMAAKAGTFRIEGDRILIRWQGEDREVNNSINTGTGCPNFMGGVTCPVATFRDGEQVTGTFSATAGGPSVGSSTRLELRGDGSYRLTRRGVVATYDAANMSEGVEEGRYLLSSKATMRLTPTQGAPREVLVFPFPAKDPSYLWFEGQMLQGSLQRR